MEKPPGPYIVDLRHRHFFTNFPRLDEETVPLLNTESATVEELRSSIGLMERLLSQTMRDLENSVIAAKRPITRYEWSHPGSLDSVDAVRYLLDVVEDLETALNHARAMLVWREAQTIESLNQQVQNE